MTWFYRGSSVKASVGTIAAYHAWVRKILVAGLATGILACSAPTQDPGETSSTAEAPPGTTSESPGTTAASGGTTAASGGTTEPAELEDLNFRLDFFAQGLSAPFLLADERGYYEDEGINISIGEGRGNVITMQAVAAGEEPLGYIAAETFILGLSQDLPITAIGWITRKTPFGAMVDADLGATTVEDLRGLQILVVSGSSDQFVTEAVLGLNGMTPEDVSLISVEGAAKSSSYLAGEADAMAMPITFGIPFLEGGERPSTAISYADFGLETMGWGIIANNDFLEANPDLVRRFLAASMRGWEEGEGDPEAAVLAMQTSFPDNQYDVDQHTDMLRLTYDFVDSDNTEDWPIGCMSSADWEETAEVVSEGPFPVERPVTDIGAHWTNEYLATDCPTG
jgi:NitT/TauT family transport system substrate-binding protein